MLKSLFGKTNNGQEIYLYTLKNKNSMEAQVTNYGAILVNLLVPDKQGALADVVLGYDNLEDYQMNSSFFGTTVGPSANRIANAKFEIDGISFQLPVNDGLNNLHSDFEMGIHKKVWNVVEGSDSITFSVNLKDGEMGFPGNKEISVTYTLTDENALEIFYKGTSDKKTLFNLTNHSYFNLKGHNKGDIHNHVLQISASKYTPIVAGAIPTGELASVTGTVFDFTQPKVIGRDIDKPVEQLKMVQGYDHNWVIDGWKSVIQKVATVEEPESGRIMDVYTDLPGIQFYAGNCIGTGHGKQGAEYGPRKGLCLETQYFPNAANEKTFPQPFTQADDLYETKTIYQFRVS